MSTLCTLEKIYELYRRRYVYGIIKSRMQCIFNDTYRPINVRTYWLMFFKTVFYCQKQRKQGKLGEHVWFFFFLKNTKNIKFRKKNTKMMLKLFSITIFKNINQSGPNISRVLS